MARLGKAAIGGLVAGLLTRWPVGVLGGFLFGYFASDLFGGRLHRNAETEQTEAIASWTEMLRDTMAAASGLEQAITTTAPIAPVAIRPQIQTLVARLRRERLSTGLAELAEGLANPVADLVVSALTLAANGEAQDLGELLGSLSGAARDGATMRLRIDASRARTRTSVRIITGVTVAMAGLLVLLNRTYLQPFDSATGQCVLLLVFACFGGALWWLVQMSRYVAPERFLVASGPEEEPWL
jgi:tight adherence protein B